MTHKAAAKFTVAKSTLADRLSGGERGASALEYVGMLLVAAIIVAAVAGLITNSRITENVSGALTDILDSQK